MTGGGGLLPNAKDDGPDPEQPPTASASNATGARRQTFRSDNVPSPSPETGRAGWIGPAAGLLLGTVPENRFLVRDRAAGPRPILNQDSPGARQDRLAQSALSILLEQRPAGAVCRSRRDCFRRRLRTPQRAPSRHGPVAQLDRALRFERSGREFESLRGRQHFRNFLRLRIVVSDEQLSRGKQPQCGEACLSIG